MVAIQPEHHLPPLGHHVHEEVGLALQATLLELIDLALVGKQLHWSIVGQRFRPMHLYLDKLVDVWRDLSDAVAERAVIIGFWPDGQADALNGRPERPAVTRGPVEDHAVIRDLLARVVAAGENARDRAERLGALDLVSQDVMIGVVRVLEEQLWMLRSQMADRA